MEIHPIRWGRGIAHRIKNHLQEGIQRVKSAGSRAQSRFANSLESTGSTVSTATLSDAVARKYPVWSVGTLRHSGRVHLVRYCRECQARIAAMEGRKSSRAVSRNGAETSCPTIEMAPLSFTPTERPALQQTSPEKVAPKRTAPSSVTKNETPAAPAPTPTVILTPTPSLTVPDFAPKPSFETVPRTRPSSPFDDFSFSSLRGSSLDLLTAPQVDLLGEVSSQTRLATAKLRIAAMEEVMTENLLVGEPFRLDQVV